MRELELLPPLHQDGCGYDCATTESMQVGISKSSGDYESSLSGFWAAHLLDICQRAAHDRHQVRKKHATLDADISVAQVERRDGVVAHHLHPYAAIPPEPAQATAASSS